MIFVWWKGLGPIALVAIAICAIVAGALTATSNRMQLWLLPWLPLLLTITFGWCCYKADRFLTQNDSLAQRSGSLLEWLEYYPHALFPIPLYFWGLGMMIVGMLGIGISLVLRLAP